ncbi:MAG: hypothetical protein V4580_08180 [Bacteroidota bacterium]
MKTLVFIYLFLFASLIKVHANTEPHSQPQPKAQQTQPPKDCVKHPQIVKPHTAERPKVAEKVVKTLPYRGGGSSIPHFSVLNFINFFYTKDTLDNLHVM